MLRQLKEAVKMYEKQLAIFEEYSSTFPEATVREWTAWVERWYADPTSKPDPFEETTTSTYSFGLTPYAALIP